MMGKLFLIKKVILAIIISVFIIFFLELYGNNIVLFLSNTFQKRVCAETFCIEKPKDWVVGIVTKNNKKYFFGIFNFLNKTKYNNTIYLTKGNKYFIIDAVKTKKICKNRIKVCGYTNSEKETYKMICRIDNSIVHIISEFVLDKNLLEKIINSYEEINKTKNNNPIEYKARIPKCIE